MCYQFSFFFFLALFFLGGGIHVHAWCPLRPEGVRSPRAGITVGFSHYVSAGNQTSIFSEEPLVLLTADPALQLSFLVFSFFFFFFLKRQDNSIAQGDLELTGPPSLALDL